jgi:hypothetical protein
MGSLERLMFTNIRDSAEPMTFAVLMESILASEGYNGTFQMWREDHASLLRSIRRALRSLIDKGFIIALGRGGRRQPFRYFLNPELFKAAGKKISDEMHAALELMLMAQVGHDMGHSGEALKALSDDDESDAPLAEAAE